jgi:hypothetical protein
VLYFCPGGQFPFPDGNPVEKMLGHQFEQPTPLSTLVPAVPRRLEAVVGRLMAKAPAAPPPERPPPWTALTGVTVGLVAGLIFWLVLRG